MSPAVCNSNPLRLAPLKCLPPPRCTNVSAGRTHVSRNSSVAPSAHEAGLRGASPRATAPRFVKRSPEHQAGHPFLLHRYRHQLPSTTAPTQGPKGTLSAGLAGSCGHILPDVVLGARLGWTSSPEKSQTRPLEHKGFQEVPERHSRWARSWKHSTI